MTLTDRELDIVRCLAKGWDLSDEKPTCVSYQEVIDFLERIDAPKPVNLLKWLEWTESPEAKKEHSTWRQKQGYGT